MISHQNLWKAFQASPIPLAVFGSSASVYSLLCCNTAYVNLFGLGEVDKVNQAPSDIFQSDSIPGKQDFISRFEQSLQNVFKTGLPDKISNLEIISLNKTSVKGERFLIDIENIPVGGESGVEFVSQTVLVKNACADPDLYTDFRIHPIHAAELARTKVNTDALINNSEELMWSVDTGYRIITANTAFLQNLKQSTGRDLREGDSVQDNAFDEQINRKWAAYYDRALGGESFTVKEEYFNSMMNRTDYSVVTFSPIRNEQGEVFGAACYSKDVTNDTLALHALEKAKNETHKIMESSLDVICTVDSDGCFITVSAAAEQIWGYTPAELVGRRYMDLVYAEDKTLTIEASRDIMGGTDMTNFENRYVRKDGSPVSMVWSARWDEAEQIMYCIAKDGTEKKLAEESLVISERRYRSLVENGADVIVILDSSGKPKYVSPSITRVLGYTEEEAMQLDLNEIAHPSDRKAIGHKMFEVLGHPGETINGHTARIRHKNGSWRWIEATLTNMIDDPIINGIVDNFRDVTERAEIEIEKNLLINNTEESFVLLNRELNIVSFNLQFELLYRNYFNVEIKKGESILSYAQPERREIVANIYARVLEGEFSVSEIMAIDPLSKETRVYSLKFKPARGPQGEIIGAFVTATDVTDRQLTLERLMESEERYKLLFQASPLPEVIYDLSTLKILDMNDRAKDHYGYSQAEFLKRSILDLWAPEERKGIDRLHKNIRMNQSVLNFGIHVHRKKGGGLIKSEVSAYKFTHRGTECVMAIYNDVTERERALERTRENEVKLLASQKIAKLGYWQSFPDKRGLYWSDEVYNIWEIDKGDFKLDFESHLNTIHPDDREKFLSSRARAFNEGAQHDLEHRIILPDCSIKWVHALGNLIRNEQGEIVIFEGTVQDITQRKTYDILLKDLNRVLRKKVEELAISNRELEQFAYVASHDLQEPLRMITSFLTQLQRKYNKQLDPKANQYINFAVDGAMRMRQIILDLLDFSRVGRVDIEIEQVSLNEVLDEVLILYRKKTEDTKALFIIGDMPVITVAKASIRQLFQNLISNAIKYQQQDSSPLIEIGFTESSSHWEFYVKDNGIGISPEYFDKIFIIFQRLHTREQYSGTGIGLAVCRKIVENFGGKLWIESELGKGSTFYFTVPKVSAETDKQAE